MKKLLGIIAIILFITCIKVDVYCQVLENDTKEIVLQKNLFTRFVYSGKLVKIDCRSTDSLLQVKGRITEIGDSAIVVNGRKIVINSIKAVYLKRMVLGTTLLIVGTSLLVCEVLLISHISVLAAAGNPNFNPFVLIPFATGLPLTVAGIISVWHWKKCELSKGWILSIKNIKSLNSLESSPP